MFNKPIIIPFHFFTNIEAYFSKSSATRLPLAAKDFVVAGRYRAARLAVGSGERTPAAPAAPFLVSERKPIVIAAVAFINRYNISSNLNERNQSNFTMGILT
jgi:hypothetical protein